MKKLTRYPDATIAALTLLLFGCASPLTMNKIQSVERDIPSKSLLSIVGRGPAKMFTVVDPGEGLEYQVQIFPMRTDISTATTFYSTSEGLPVPLLLTYPISEDFAFLFLEDSLLFWGFLHEYARCDEEVIRRLAPIIIEGSERREERGDEAD